MRGPTVTFVDQCKHHSTDLSAKWCSDRFKATNSGCKWSSADSTSTSAPAENRPFIYGSSSNCYENAMKNNAANKVHKKWWGDEGSASVARCPRDCTRQMVMYSMWLLRPFLQCSIWSIRPFRQCFIWLTISAMYCLIDKHFCDLICFKAKLFIDKSQIQRHLQLRHVSPRCLISEFSSLPFFPIWC